MKKFLLLPGVCSLALGLMALPTSAATTQQILNQALKNDVAGPTRTDATFNIKVVHVNYSDKTQNGTADIQVKLSQRELPGANKQVDGRLVMDKFLVTGPQPMSLTGNIALQWKFSGDSVFLRIESVPAELMAMLKAEGLDLAPYVGNWYSFTKQDVTDVLSGLKALSSTQAPLTALEMTTDKASLKALVGKPVLLVTAVEKRTTDAAGHKIARLRVRINPAFINALRVMEVSKINTQYRNRATTGMTLAERNAALKEVSTKFVELNKVLSKLRLVAVVDLTDTQLDRMELGWSDVQPEKSCAWNTGLKRSVCRTVGNTRITLAAGVSVNPDPGTPVELPPYATPLRDLFNKMMGANQ